jgi:cobaltochelatase CobS
MNKPIACQVCGFIGHDLRPHFEGGRSASCSVTLAEYQVRYPGKPVTSNLFDSKLADIQAIRKTSAPDIMALTPTEYDPKTTFGIDMGDKIRVPGFVQRHGLVPDIDPGYQFAEEATKIAILGLVLNKPTMIHGPTGSGKTTLIEQICARINYPCVRINHHADMYAFDIIGQLQVKNGETVFKNGPLPFAMERPIVLIMDEWDAINPEIGMMYQPVLERQPDGRLGSLLLTASGENDKKVVAHKGFRVVATSNTTGLGDDKGLYQGTQVQNLAFVSRFQLRVKLDYLSPEVEAQVLGKKFPGLTKVEKERLTKTAVKIREQHEAGKLEAPYSLRDLLNWTEIYTLCGDAGKAMGHTYSSVFPFQTAKTISEIVQRIWG